MSISFRDHLLILLPAILLIALMLANGAHP